MIRTRDVFDRLSSLTHSHNEAEGGCGVIGIASAEKVAGRHLLPALCQMGNRGNGKGGGIAAVGLDPKTFNVTQHILNNTYLLAIAYLERSCQLQLENEFIHSVFTIEHIYEMPHLPYDQSALKLDVRPPDAVLYFVKVKKEMVDKFREKHKLFSLPQEAIEDEIVYQNTERLNRCFYVATGDKKAFVLSHGKDLLVLKLVGYGDDVIRYYKLEDFHAHVWIGHHRYPTKGRVWHPGGAHPFIGMNEALVHNGDFANYYSICEYLAQRNIYPHFLTDTEVAVLLLDLLHRTYQYPLEYVIEAFAPTTERDFFMLPEEKKRIYQLLQKTHIHGSPDGPWFFLIAQSLVSKNEGYRLIGITDTSMLRPQVFALQNGEVPIGFAASEKQAIDAVLESLAKEDERFWPCADFYWNARGGSYTDGGAFTFTVSPQADGSVKFICADKFGTPIHNERLKPAYRSAKRALVKTPSIPKLSSADLLDWFRQQLPKLDYEDLSALLDTMIREYQPDVSIEVMTQLLDLILPLGNMRRSCFRVLITKKLNSLFGKARKPSSPGYAFVINAEGFPAEGENSLALKIVSLSKQGFKHFILYNCHGQRFIGNGLGRDSKGIRIDVYGSSGDYLASGIDGAEIYVHGTAQDQLAQIMKDGRLVVHGDVGQTFMYGAKGGAAFVRGNTAGRPLINAVGSPRVVINGTCLDYLAESFMAGNPLKGGGFVILNGIAFDEEGIIQELPTPYPGSNLFSLATGGALYIRDPGRQVGVEQLNGGEFAQLTEHDWELILPYLEENAKLFGIPVARLLQYKGEMLDYKQAYVKVHPTHIRALQEEEAWVKIRD